MKLKKILFSFSLLGLLFFLFLNFQEKEKKNYVLITIDVEAQTARAENSHVEKLIYGKFPEKAPAGIVEMMEIANRAKEKLNLFVDFCEEGLYGKEILIKITKDIIKMGHDVQAHCHPATLGKKFWNSKLQKNPSDMQNRFDKKTSDIIFAKFKQTIELIKKELKEEEIEKLKITAYRSGSYRYNDNILKSLNKEGFSVTTNYSNRKSRKITSSDLGMHLDPFYWVDKENEKITLELPIHAAMNTISKISYVTPHDGQWEEADMKGTKDYEVFWEDMNKIPSPVITIIFHSWSFLCPTYSSYCNKEKNNTKNFRYGKDSIVEEKKKDFYTFLKKKPHNFELITIQELNKLIEEGKIKVDKKVSIEKAKFPQSAQASSLLKKKSK